MQCGMDASVSEDPFSLNPQLVKERDGITLKRNADKIFFFDAIRILESRKIAAGDKKRPARFFPRCTHPKTPIPIIHPRESFWKKKKVIEVSYRYIESEFLSKFHHCYMFLWLILSKCTLCYKKTHRFVLANQSRALDFHVAGHTAVDNGSL